MLSAFELGPALSASYQRSHNVFVFSLDEKLKTLQSHSGLRYDLDINKYLTYYMYCMSPCLEAKCVSDTDINKDSDKDYTTV